MLDDLLLKWNVFEKLLADNPKTAVSIAFAVGYVSNWVVGIFV